MNDDELRDWRAHWREAPDDDDGSGVDVARAHARARRDDRRHRWLAIAEYVGTALVLMGAAVYAALRRDSEPAWLWLATLWTLGLPALGFAWWNRRGLWGGGGAGALDHLRLQRRRCVHGLRAIRVGYGLLAASTGSVLLFAFGVIGGRHDGTAAMLAVLVPVVAVHLAVMAWMQRRIARRLRGLDALLREFDEDGPSGIDNEGRGFDDAGNGRRGVGDNRPGITRGDGVPDDGMPEDGMPDDRTLDEAMPDDGVPADGVPGDRVPDDRVSHGRAPDDQGR